MFPLRKPSGLFAFPVILSMWEFQDRPEEIAQIIFVLLVLSLLQAPLAKGF